MIEVITFSASGVRRDRAEAPDPEGAVLAARTLLHEARDAGCSGTTASFYVEGSCVRHALSPVDLSA